MKRGARWAFIAAGGALACSAHAANLISNPDFTSSLDDWFRTTANGSMEWDTTTGSPAAPSMHLVSDPASPDVAAETTCIAMDGGTNFDFSMNAKATSGMVSASILAYSDANCENTLDSIDTNLFNADGHWHTYSLTNTPLPSGTMSVGVAVTAIIGASGEVGDANFDHIEFGPAGSLTPIAINQEGLTGTWYNPNTSGQGLQLSIFPDASTPTNGTLFGAWYTYDVASGAEDTQRWYSLDASLAADATSAAVTIYRNTGGNFNAPPSTNAVAVGSGTIQFDSCTSGTFTYAFDDGRNGSMPIVSLLPNVECVESGTPTNPPSDFGLSGAWYNAGTSGQGIIVDVDPVDAQVFMGWYTYVLPGAPRLGLGQRWFSAQAPYTVGTKTMDLTVYASTGGTFDSSATPVSTTPVGTATLTFSDCSNATLDYDFTDGEFSGETGSITLTRLGAAPESCGG